MPAPQSLRRVISPATRLQPAAPIEEPQAQNPAAEPTPSAPSPALQSSPAYSQPSPSQGSLPAVQPPAQASPPGGVDPRQYTSSSLRELSQPEARAWTNYDRAVARDNATMARQQQAAARQAEVEQRRQERAAAQNRRNTQRAFLQSQGITPAQGADGNIVPAIDPLSGLPDSRALKGKVEYDESGRAFQMERPADGDVRQHFLDANATIGSNPVDHNDRYIYRQNKMRPWDAIDPQEGLFSMDPKVAEASSQALLAARRRELQTEKDKLEAETKDPANKIGYTPTQVQEARARIAAGETDPTAVEIARRADSWDARQKRLSEIGLSEAELKSMSAADFGKAEAGKRKPEDVMAIRNRELEQSKKALTALDATLKGETEAFSRKDQELQARIARGYTAAEAPLIAQQLGSMAVKRQALQAKLAAQQARVDAHNQYLNTTNSEVERFNKEAQDKAKAEQDERDKATGVAPVDAAAPPVTLDYGYEPKWRKGVKEARTTADLLTAIAQNPGTDIYIRPGANEAMGSPMMKTTEAGDRRLFGRGQAPPDATVPENIFKQRDQGLAQVNAVTETARSVVKAAQDAALASADQIKELEKQQNGPPSPDALAALLEQNDPRVRQRFEALGQELSDIRDLAWQGAIPMNRVIDAYKAAGRTVMPVPDLAATLDAAGPRNSKDPAVAKARLDALKEYGAKYSAQPTFDPGTYEQAAADAGLRLKEETHRAAGFGHVVANELSNGLDQYLSTWNLARAATNHVRGDEEGFLKAYKQSEDFQKAAEQRGGVVGPMRDAWERGDMWQYGAKTFLNMIPDLAETMTLAFAGGAIGTAAEPGGGTIAGTVAGAFSKGFLKKAVAEEATKLIAKGVAKEAAFTMAQRSVMAALKPGASAEAKAAVAAVMKQQASSTLSKIGTLASSFRGNAGEYLQNTLGALTPEQMAKDPEAVNRAIFASLAMGVPAAALDALDGVESGMVSRLFGGSAKDARHAAEKGARRFLTELGEGAKDIGKEASTGWAQGVLGIYARRMAEGRPFDEVIGKGFTTKEQDEILENAVGEAIGGGAFTGVRASIGGVRRALAPIKEAWTLRKAGKAAEKSARQTDLVINATPQEMAAAAGITPQEAAAAMGPSRSMADFAELPGLTRRREALMDAASKARAEGRRPAATEAFRAAQLLDTRRRQVAIEGVRALAGVERELAQPVTDPATGTTLMPGTPEHTATTTVARALVGIANGRQASLTNAELASVDLARGPKGELVQAKGQTTAPDGIPRVTIENGQPIITQGAADRVSAMFPAAGALLGTPEAVRRAEVAAAPQPQEGQQSAPKQQQGQNGRQFEVTIDGQQDPVVVTAATRTEAGEKAAAMGLGMVRSVLEVPRQAPQPQSQPQQQPAANQPPTTTPPAAQPLAQRIPGMPTTGTVSSGNIASALLESRRQQNLPVTSEDAKRASSLSKTLQAELDRWKAAFPGGVHFADQTGSGGLEIHPGDRRLVIDLPALARTAEVAGENSQAWARRAVLEEAIHSAALDVEQAGNLKPAELYNGLPKPIQELVRKAYLGKTTDPRVLGHEFLRMLVQGKLAIRGDRWVDGDGKIVTTEQAVPKVKSAVRRAITALLEHFRRLLAKFEGRQLGGTLGAIQSAVSHLESMMLAMESAPTAESSNEPDQKTPSDGGKVGEQSVPESQTVPVVPAEQDAPAPEAAPESSPEAGDQPGVDTGAEASQEWVAFPEYTGTLGIPRAEMPQIDSGDRSALLQFLRARGYDYTEDTVPASELKPTQAEFSPERVETARKRMEDGEAGQRAILVSQNNYVLDGHHQWLAYDPDEEIRVIRINASPREALEAIDQFPSMELDDSSGKAAAAPPPPAAAKKPARRPAGRLFRSDHANYPLVSALADAGIRPRNPAAVLAQELKRRGKNLSEKAREALRRRGAYDDLPKISEYAGRPIAQDALRQIYQNGNTNTPDQALQQVANAIGRPEADFYGNTAWQEIREELHRLDADALAEAEQQDQIDEQERQHRAFYAATQDGEIRVEARDLVPGEKLDVEGEQVRVTAIERDRDGNPAYVVLDDGTRFGRQEVGVDAALFVEGYDAQSPDWTVQEQAAEEPAPEPVQLETQTDEGITRERKKADNRRRIRDRQNAPLQGTAGDMTPDMLAPGTEENALFTRPPETPPAEAAAPAPELTPAQQRLKAMADRIRQRDQPLQTAAPAPQAVYRTTIPREEVAELRDIAEMLHFDDGINTPEALAQSLSQLNLREFSENVWSGIRAINPIEPASPDWNAIYGAIDQPQTTQSNEPPDRAGNQGEVGPNSPGLPRSDAQNEGTGAVLEAEPAESAEGTDTARSRDGLREGAGTDGEGPAAGTGKTKQPRRGRTGGRGDVRGHDDAGGRERGSAGLTVREAEEAVQPSVVVQDGEKSPQRPNYHLTNPAAILGGGPKRKFARNQSAIETYQNLLTANREPTREELDTLAGYIGWGSFGQELFQGSWEKPAPKSGWEKESQWLRDHTGEKEWRALQTSIINAHYTDPVTVQAVWDIIKALGFPGGRILEPSVGIGNFFGLMPREINSASQLTGIEMEPMSAGIAAMLYPQANIQVKPYEKSQTPDNFYDLVVGNWPFSDGKPVDRRYNDIGAVLHDYFFIKALDQTRPGGLVVGITSNGTLDKKSQRARAEMAKRGELVAAFRLPSGAFQEYAGTKVVTDLIVFRKTDKPADPAKSGFLTTTTVQTPGGPVEVNEYYARNPSHVLGTLNFGHGTTTYRQGMIVDRPADLEQRMAALPSMLPQSIGYEAPKSLEVANSYVSNNTTDRQGAVTIQDGGLYVVRGEQLQPLSEVVKYEVKDERKTKTREEQLRALVRIRGALGRLLDAQRKGEDTATPRRQLNTLYDVFVSKHGPITPSEGLKILWRAQDPFAASLQGLERSVDQKRWTKREIFHKDLIRGKASIENPTILDAYAIARNDSLTLDLGDIARRTSATVDAVERELLDRDLIYRTPVGTYQPPDVYLAGNVRTKYREALEAKEQGVPGMDRSLEALSRVIPADIPYFQIEPKIGATWIASEDYQDFIRHLLNAPEEGGISVDKMPRGWLIDIAKHLTTKAEATTAWGVDFYPFRKLVSAAMNNALITIRHPKQEDGSQPIDVERTTAANAKVEAIRDEFTNWIWKDASRASRLEKNYNEVFNAIAIPKYNGSHLAFEGLALERGDQPFQFRQHQVDAVWRGVLSGRGIYAHEVGTGKSLVMAGLAMESRRLGRAKKPMLLGHNANARQVAAEIQGAYPGAKILFVDNFSPSTRAATLGQIALDDWDAVIMPHSLIDRLTLRPESVEALVQEQIQQLEEAAIAAADEDGASLSVEDMDDPDKLKKLRSPTAKELVKEREKIKAQIEKARQLAEKPDSVFFEDLGVDMMIVDEAHIFKKLPIPTKQKLKGLNLQGSQRGLTLGLLTDYIKRLNDGTGVHLFTGTPITNTLNEVYNMMRYTMSDVMKRDGVATWDDWFNAFAASSSEVELNSAGEWAAVERLSSFVNLPELRRMVGQYLDIVFADDMPEFHPRDSREGRTEDAVGRPFRQVINDIAPMTPAQKVHKQMLQDRYAKWQKMSGREKQQAMREGAPEMPLSIETEGVKAAMDYRLIDLQGADSPQSKASRVVRNVMRHYEEHPKATQMIFMGTGFSDFRERTEGGVKIKEPTFNLAKDIRNRLIGEGVRPEEIAIFSDLDATERKTAAEKMQKGEIRVAIGSTETMGTGVNAQKEMRAMHHMDAPWMPGDLEQRNGRGWRQGNRWNTVMEYRYLTEGSHDGRRWQILLTKDRFIKLFMRADDSVRVIEGDAVDMDEGGGGGFEETFSAAAGDPRILMREKLTKDVNKLLDRQRSHWLAISDAKTRAAQLRSGITRMERELPVMQEDGAAYDARKEAEYAITIGGKQYQNRDAADEALIETYERIPISESQANAKWVKVGEFRGFDLYGTRVRALSSLTPKIMLQVRGKGTYPVNSITVRSAERTLRELTQDAGATQQAIRENETSIRSLEELANTPFGRQTDLDKRQKQLADLTADLAQNPTPAPAWLRNGAPIGSSVYVDGQEYAVAGHRVADGTFYVLVDKPDGVEPVDYLQVQNDTGAPLFEEMGALQTAPFTGMLGNPRGRSKATTPPPPPEEQKPQKAPTRRELERKATEEAQKARREAERKKYGFTEEQYANFLAGRPVGAPAAPTLAPQPGFVPSPALQETAEGYHPEYETPRPTGMPDMAVMTEAYRKLARQAGTDSVFISDLAKESGQPLDNVRAWVREMQDQGLGTLDEGDWSTASAEQRRASVPLRNRLRLYFRLHSEALQSSNFDDLFAEQLRKAGISLEDLDAFTATAAGEQSGARTVGRPDLALGGGVGNYADPVIMGTDAYRAATATEETFDQWDAEAAGMLQADYHGTMEDIINAGMNGQTLSPQQTRAAMMLTELEGQYAMTPQRQRRLHALVYAYRQTGTVQSRGFTARRDPFKTVEQRHREYLIRSIFTPPAEERVKLEEAETQEEKNRILNRDAVRIKKIEAALARMGITLEDLFGGGVHLSLVKSATVQEAMSKLTPAEQRAARATQGAAKSFKEIGTELGMKPEAVQAAKAKAARLLEANLRERLARARQGALQTANPAPDDLIGVNFEEMARMSEADAEAEIQKIMQRMGFFPDSQQGKRKTVRRRPQPVAPPPPRRGEPLSPELEAYANTRRQRPGFGQQPRLPGSTPPADTSIPPGPGQTTNGRLKLSGDQPPAPVSPELEAYLRSPRGRQGFSQQPRLPGSQTQADESIPPGEGRVRPRPSTNQDELGLFPSEPAEMSILNGADLSNPEDAMQVSRIAQAAGANGLDMLQEFWINNILSGPQTQVANLLGNAAFAGWDFTVQRGAEALLNLLTRSKTGPQFGEFPHMMRALMPGFAQALRLGRKTWRSETDWFANDVLNAEPELFGEFGPKGEGRRAAIPGKIGRGVRVPSRLLMSTDAFFKRLTAQLEAAAQAYRIAKREGLTGEALTKRMNSLIYSPGSQAWQLAVQKARELTFQEELKPGSVAYAVNRMRNSNRLMQFLLPFLRTPYNIFRHGIRKSPLGTANLLYQLGKTGLYKISTSKKSKDTYRFPRLSSLQISAPEAGQLIKWAAEQTIAWGAMALLKGAAEGDDDDWKKRVLFTGSAPLNRDARELQERALGGPNTLRIGDLRFPYGRIEPIATVLGSVVDALRTMKSDQPGREKAGALLGSLQNAALNKTFMGGLADLFDALRYPSTISKKGERFLLTALVPNIIRQPLRNMDPMERESTTADWWHTALPTGDGAAPRIDTATGEEIPKAWNAASRLLLPPPSASPTPQKSDVVLTQYNRRAEKPWAPDPIPLTRQVRIGPGGRIAITGGETRRLRLNKVTHNYLSKRSALLAKRALETMNLKPTDEDVDRIRKAYEHARKQAWDEIKGRELSKLGELE